MTIGTLTLADFLLARITDDERVVPTPDFERSSTSRAWYSTDFDVVFVEEDRWLADCAAKRRIIEWHKAWPVLVETPPTFDQGDDESYDWGRGAGSSMTLRVSQRIAWTTEQQYREKFGGEPPTGPVLRLLALPYADHPDYRDEWRP